MGASVASTGDFNGDGRPDVIVGAPGVDAGDEDKGRAYVFFGRPIPSPSPDLVLDIQVPLALPHASMGCAVAGVGDFNADGYDDVVVGAKNALPTEPRAAVGLALIFFGGPAPDAIADLVLRLPVWFQTLPQEPSCRQFGRRLRDEHRPQ